MPTEEQKQQEFQNKMIKAVMEATSATVVSTVNGKINKLSADFSDYIKEDIAWKSEDEAWKRNATPAIDAMLAALGWGKTTMWTLGFLGGFAAVLGGIVALVPYIIPHFQK